jgi:hypothetical protein
MIRYAKEAWPPSYMGQRGAVGISTNLSCLHDAEGLVSSGVDRIRVSISGISQEVYGRNHVGGDIAKVLENLIRLVEAREKLGLSGLSLGIGFQDLIYNGQEAEAARGFCSRHGLFFIKIPMYISSVEENILFHKNRSEMGKFYGQFIDVAREERSMKTARETGKCQFRRSTITLNQDARVCRCCGVFESRYLLGSFFDYRIRQIPRLDSNICRVCAETPMSWR